MANPKTLTNPYGGGRTPGPRPDLVIYPGILATQRRAYCCMRSQAKFRKELFTLTWDRFQELWESKWHQRGLSNTSLCMTRTDHRMPWSDDNTIITTRLEHCSLRGRFKGHPSED